MMVIHALFQAIHGEVILQAMLQQAYFIFFSPRFESNQLRPE